MKLDNYQGERENVETNLFQQICLWWIWWPTQQQG